MTRADSWADRRSRSQGRPRRQAARIRGGAKQKANSDVDVRYATRPRPTSSQKAYEKIFERQQRSAEHRRRDRNHAGQARLGQSRTGDRTRQSKTKRGQQVRRPKPRRPKSTPPTRHRTPQAHVARSTAWSSTCIDKRRRMGAAGRSGGARSSASTGCGSKATLTPPNGSAPTSMAATSPSRSRLPTGATVKFPGKIVFVSPRSSASARSTACGPRSRTPMENGRPTGCRRHGRRR